MRSRHALAILAWPLVLSGCGMVFQGSGQEVNLVSEPDSARVEVDGRDFGTTPARVRLERKHSHVITLKKSGYERDTVEIHGSMHPAWATLDVLAGVFPVVCDGASGDWKRFAPEIHTRLNRLEPSAAETTGAVLASADEDTLRPDKGTDWLPDGRTVSALGGSAELSCHVKAGSSWLGDGWVEIRSGAGTKVSNHSHGSFHDKTMHLVQGDSFYALSPAGEIFQVRVAEVVAKKGASIEWSRR